MSKEQSDNIRTKMIITSVCAAGIATALYFFFRKKGKSRKKEESIVYNEDSKVSALCKVQKNTSLQISRNIVISVNTNNQELAMVSKVENINISSIKKSNHYDSESRLSEVKSNLQKKFKQMDEAGSQSNLYRKQFRQLEDGGSQSNLYRKQFQQLEENASLGYERRKNKKKKTLKEKEYNLSKLSLKNSYHADAKYDDFQYKEFIKELEEMEKSRKNLEPSNNLIDTHIMFESDGYIEEDEDLHENVKVDMLDDNFTVTSKPEKQLGNNLVIDHDKIIINNEEELKEVLFGKTKYKDFYCSLKLIERIINENEKVLVINEKELLVLLAYLYKDLHPGLIELGDNFVEERRKYFKVDNDTYINIINYFLRKKEEFFLCVLSDLMSKLNISQKVLDNTFYYYMNIAENSSKEVQMIKAAYDKVYHAGLKYSIAPKNLTKNKLKKVLEYQCETYDNLMKKYPTYEPDVIEIMVTDHVYLEYGLDREAIKAAIKKHNVYQDYNFENVIVKLENFQNNSFINI